MPKQPEWTVAPHPTMPGFSSLRRITSPTSREYLRNRIGDHPEIEAFVTQEQAQRVASFISRRDVDVVEAQP